MRIPYYIQRVRPNNDVRYNNIINIAKHSAKKVNLDEDIIDFIVVDMYDFCSDIYGYGIQISSYEDFCNKYWELQDCQIQGWLHIYQVYYFENNVWMQWNIEDKFSKIYEKYVERFHQI